MSVSNRVLSLAGFKKSYGSALALSVDDLTFEEGIYWVKGVNGSGKSTFLRTVAGMLSFSGSITLDGTIDLKNNPVEYRRLVNFGEAEPVYPAFITGRELVSVFISAKGADPVQAENLAREMKMESFLEGQTGTYSSGMLKKLSLLLAFIGSPRIILLDEPLITLDTASLAILYSWIVSRHKQGTTFLITSHQEPDETILTGINSLMVDNRTILRN